MERAETLQAFLDGEASAKQFYFEYPHLLKMNKTSTSGRKFGLPVRVPSDKDFSDDQVFSTVESLKPPEESAARITQRRAHEKRLQKVKKAFTK